MLPRDAPEVKRVQVRVLRCFYYYYAPTTATLLLLLSLPLTPRDFLLPTNSLSTSY